MQIENIKKIGVIGSGTMGRGIAICSALSGYDTLVYDIKDEIIKASKESTEKDLSKSVEKKKLTEEKKSEALERTVFTSEFDDLNDCDFVIEAALESIDLKKDIFGRLDKICREDAILSTNTSSLSVTNISTAVKKNPDRVLGMHFFNPAHIMKLVEIVKGDFTSDEV